MSPVEHALSGVLASSLAASAWPGPLRDRGRWVLWTTIGVLCPDLDAVTLLFNHNVYFGSAWYSHRQFLHSILGCAFLAMLLPSVVTVVRRRDAPIEECARILKIRARAIFAGGLLHLLSDLPTPPGPWDGLPIFFPLAFRAGGWSHLGWVNAALFYFLASAALAVGGLAIAHRSAPAAARAWLRGAAGAVAAMAIGGTVWFIGVSHYESFDQWRAWQSRFIPVLWVDGFYHTGRYAAVLWQREVLRVY